VYGENVHSEAELLQCGLRIMKQEAKRCCPSGTKASCLTGPKPFVIKDDGDLSTVKYLLTFGDLICARNDQASYLAGHLHLLPYPGSLAFWVFRIA